MRVSMSEDDAAYTDLLTQLLSDTSSTRNARVHSWIEHQYDFALSEQDTSARDAHMCLTSVAKSRTPSPSPSSSLGAHRSFSIDRPDSPLLPRSSVDSPSSPHLGPCPSYDALFFPQADVLSDDNQLEERERERTLKFLVQEMARRKSQSMPSTPHKHGDKPILLALASTSAFADDIDVSIDVISRSQVAFLYANVSSAIFHKHAFGSNPTAGHFNTSPSRICHSAREDLFPHQENGTGMLQPQDDKDSVFPSPTLSNFSCTYSRETSITTPCVSLPTSPASASFMVPPLPENIALPASPEVERAFFSETASVSAEGAGTNRSLSPANALTPVANASPASPASASFTSSSTSVFLASSAMVDPDTSAQTQCLRAALSGIQSESRWSITTTASVDHSVAEPVKSGSFLSPRTPSKGKKSQQQKEAKTPKQRTRFINFISRLSPGRNDVSTSTIASAGSAKENCDDDVPSDSDEDDAKGKCKPTKGLNKKSSLASIRMSFSLSRTSFSGQRPPVSSVTEEVPPLPMSPTRTSMSTGDLSSGPNPQMEAIPAATSPAKSSIPRISSRSNILEPVLPPIPGSAGTVTTFRNASQLSLSNTVSSPAASSKVSLLPSPTVSTFPSSGNPLGQHHSGSASRISLLPPSNKRVSFQSSIRNAFGSSADEPESVHPFDSSPPSTLSKNTTPSRTKSIFKLSNKSKAPKTRTNALPALVPVVYPVKAPKATVSASVPHLHRDSSASKSTPMLASNIPSSTKFTPPTKLANVLAGQTPAPPYHSTMSKIAISNSRTSPPPRSKLSTPPSKMRPPASSRAPRSVATAVSGIKVPVHTIDGGAKIASTDDLVGVSKLPLSSLQTQRTKMGTVKGFWRK
ncbi:hypothetical protein ID866_3767 [Astraeus odoratus]|nr:hypothetical protein ID866_3767 [Astraeus odoratus]